MQVNRRLQLVSHALSLVTDPVYYQQPAVTATSALELSDVSYHVMIAFQPATSGKWKCRIHPFMCTTVIVYFSSVCH